MGKRDVSRIRTVVFRLGGQKAASPSGVAPQLKARTSSLIVRGCPSACRAVGHRYRRTHRPWVSESPVSWHHRAAYVRQLQRARRPIKHVHREETNLYDASLCMFVAFIRLSELVRGMLWCREYQVIVLESIQSHSRARHNRFILSPPRERRTCSWAPVSHARGHYPSRIESAGTRGLVLSSFGPPPAGAVAPVGRARPLPARRRRTSPSCWISARCGATGAT